MIEMSRCVICNGPRGRTVGPHPDFAGHEIIRCGTCTMIAVDPRPSVDQLAKRYRETYRTDVHEYPTDAYLAFMDRRAIAQRAFISTHSRFDNTSRVLDIGCSAGSLLLSFGDGTPNLDGFEPDVMMARIARDRLPPSARIFNELCDPAVLPAETYDLITLSHVFEHVLDPVGFLGHLLRAARPDGLVFIEVPNESVSEVKRQVRVPPSAVSCIFPTSTPRRSAAALSHRGVLYGRFQPTVRAPVRIFACFQRDVAAAREKRLF